MSLKISRRAVLRLAGVLTAVALPCQSFAQPAACNRKALVESGKLEFAYAIRSGGYCDGSVAFEHGAALQLISYTMGPVRFAPGQAKLKLQSVLDAEATPTVLGIDQRSDGSYRFEAVLPPSGLEFDLRPAVHPKGLKAEDLGFVAWTMRNGRPVYFPVAVGSKQAGDVPILVMRAPIAVVQAAYQICEESGTCAKQMKWAANVEAGSRLQLKLPTATAPRQVTVKFTIVGPGSSELGEVVQVQIP